MDLQGDERTNERRDRLIAGIYKEKEGVKEKRKTRSGKTEWSDDGKKENDDQEPN